MFVAAGWALSRQESPMVLANAACEMASCFSRVATAERSYDNFMAAATLGKSGEKK